MLKLICMMTFINSKNDLLLVYLQRNYPLKIINKKFQDNVLFMIRKSFFF